MKPIHKYNSGATATLCNGCRTVITPTITQDIFCIPCKVENHIQSFPTENREGFTGSEIKEILLQYPNINMDKLHEALTGITCIMRNNQMVIYHSDLEKAILCGIGNRDLRFYEND